MDVLSKHLSMNRYAGFVVTHDVYEEGTTTSPPPAPLVYSVAMAS